MNLTEQEISELNLVKLIEERDDARRELKIVTSDRDGLMVINKKRWKHA